jgi:hypothetical protein
MSWSKVQQIFEALFHTDPMGDSYADLKVEFADAAIWESDAFVENRVTGPSAIVEALMAFRQQFDSWTIQLVDPPLGGVPGSTVSVPFEFTVEGTAAEFFQTYHVGGRHIEFRAAGVMEFEASGQIVAVRTFWNCGAILSQIGVRPHGRPGVSEAPRDQASEVARATGGIS